MANTFITPSVIASRALATLYNTIVLAGLVHRDYDQAFSGKVGDTITVRTPATFTVDEFDRGDGIQLQNITEGSFPVALDTILDVSFPVTAEELSLELDDFSNRVLNPAMEAIAQDVDGRLAELLVDTAENSGAGGGGTVSGATTPNDAWRLARAKMGRAKLPFDGRYAVLSPEAVSDALSDDLLVTANQSGSTDALRDASLGRIFGFENYESQVFGYGPGDKGQADGVAFHRDSVALVSRTLEKPMGVADGQFSVQSYKSLGLRVVRDYDITKKQDIVSIDFLMGIKAIPGRQAGVIQLDFGQGS